jgi:hypothetical protein
LLLILERVLSNPCFEMLHKYTDRLLLVGKRPLDNSAVNNLVEGR